MILHLGKDLVIPLRDIIAIIDSESALTSDNTKEFLKQAHEKGIIDNSASNVKTYIITEKTIYTSNISSMTLKQRAGFMEGIANV